MRKLNFFSLALVTFLFAGPASVSALTTVERTSLHAAMVQHIDRQAVNGLYLQVDLTTGKVNTFTPAKSHPMVLTMGDHFVLCTDFKDEKGNATNVDFYVARRGKSFAVFHTEINNRGPLTKLIEAGTAIMSQ